MANHLEVAGLGKRYPGFALEDVSFVVPEGRVMGFIGPNGAGKTTTLKSILGITRYDAGVVRLFGRDNALGEQRWGEQTGVVMDTPFYVDEWTVSDVEAAVSPFYKRWDGEEFAGFLQRFDIDRGKRVKELSRGMKVKLMLAVALSHDARLLILDEPTSGLDPVARDELCDTLSEYVADGDRSVLFSTHITSDLEKVADEITFILNGRVVFTGDKKRLLEKYSRVTGGTSALDARCKGLILGYKEHEGAFAGMVAAGDVAKLPEGVRVEPVSLEEIIIFMNRGSVDA